MKKRGLNWVQTTDFQGMSRPQKNRFLNLYLWKLFSTGMGSSAATQTMWLGMLLSSLISLTDIHGLGPEMRKFVEIAALVHDTGVATDFENHHKAGRAILRLHPPSELPERLWPAVAWTTFLHKKKVGEKKLMKLREKTFGKMPEDLQDLTLKAAALLRLADALDYSRMESRIGDVKISEKIIKFEIKGQGAEIDAERMSKKGDLWHVLHDIRLEFRPVIK